MPRACIPLLQPLGLKILIEPGRFIAGNAGILVTRVEYVKTTGRKNFIIVDAAMNDLIRPAFYDSYHEIVPVKQRGGPLISSDVVGPVCESADFFCKDRPLPAVAEGDFLALFSAGAYGFVMASNYNTRALAAEVMVDGAKSAVVRRRQRVEELWAGERSRPGCGERGFLRDGGWSVGRAVLCPPRRASARQKTDALQINVEKLLPKEMLSFSMHPRWSDCGET